MGMVQIWKVIQLSEEISLYRVSDLMKIYWTCANGIIFSLKKV